MQITLKEIFDSAADISVDNDGLEPEVRINAFNNGYSLFLRKFDKIFPEKRLKSLKFPYDVGGNSIKEYGEDVTGAKYDDLFHPYDVHWTDVEETFYDPVDPSSNRFTEEKRWFCDTEKIYFLNFVEGDYFIVRYLPQFKWFPRDQSESVKVYLPERVLPNFCHYLLSIYNAVEQEPNQSGTPEMIFDQYFSDLEDIIVDDSEPVAFSH